MYIGIKYKFIYPIMMPIFGRNNNPCATLNRLFKIILILILLYVGVSQRAKAQNLSGGAMLYPTTNVCVGDYELMIMNLSLTNANVTDVSQVSVEIDWGDGSNWAPVSGFTIAGTGPTTINGTISHSFNPIKPECLYVVNVRVRHPLGTTQYNGAALKATVWSRDRDGRNELSLVDTEMEQNVYPVCRNNPFSIDFINNSWLACNMIPDPVDGNLTLWNYDRNNILREYQFVYYPDTSSPGGGITGVTVSGTGVTSTGTDRYIGPVKQWQPGGAPEDQPMAALSDLIESINNDPTNETGSRYVIECRMWNECNPRSTHADDPDVIYAYIEIVEVPPTIPDVLTEHCYNTAGTLLRQIGSETNSGGYTPGGGFFPGNYRWYEIPDNTYTATNLNTDAITPARPLYQDIKDTHFYSHALATNTTVSINPTSTSGTPSFPTANRVGATTPGFYKYWLTYEFTSTNTTTLPSGEVVVVTRVCPTPPSMQQWTVRENIQPIIDVTKVTGAKTVCSGEVVVLSLPIADYPDSYTYGGLVNYEWQLGTTSGLSTGATVSSLVTSGTRDRTVTFTVDPDYRQVSGSNAVINIQVRRRWANLTTAGTDCGSDWVNVPITLRPLPTAILTGNVVDVCSGDNATLTVCGVAGATGSVAFDIVLNDGSTFNNLTFANKTATQSINPTQVTGPAVTEYFIYSIKDRTSGCITTNPYDGATGTPNNPVANSSKIRPYRNNGTGAASCTSTDPPPVRVTWRKNMSDETVPNPTNPASSFILCSETSVTFDFGVAPADVAHPVKEVSTGTGVRQTLPMSGSYTGRDIPTRYRWYWDISTATVGAVQANPATVPAGSAGWWATSAQTISVTMPTITASNFEGTKYTLRLLREYADPSTTRMCGETARSTWEYTVVPAPTITIKTPQTVETCENSPPGTEMKIDFTTTGYITGNWTVEYRLTGNGMTPKDYTTALGTAATATQTATAGRGEGTISIPLSDFTGSPNKYGTYTVEITSVSQASGSASGCPITFTAPYPSQIITLRQTPTAAIGNPAAPQTICENQDFTTMEHGALSFTGETGVPYNITYRSLDNGNVELCDERAPLEGAFTASASNWFVLPQACIDNSNSGNSTYIQLVTVTQTHTNSDGSYTCIGNASGLYELIIEKIPDKAIIDKSLPTEVCDDFINITANTPDPLTSDGEWKVWSDPKGFPSGAMPGTDYGFEAHSNYFATTSTPVTTFGIHATGAATDKYGRYVLIWEISPKSPSPFPVCPSSTDTLVITLATHAMPAHIYTESEIVCENSIVMRVDQVLGGWETPDWIVIDGPNQTAIDYANDNLVPGGSYPYDRLLTVPESGTYIYKFERQVPPGCDNEEALRSITFNIRPIIDWDGLLPSYCPDDEIEIEFKPHATDKSHSDGVMTYEWYAARTIIADASAGISSKYQTSVPYNDNPLLVLKAPANNENRYEEYVVNRIRGINTLTLTNTGSLATLNPATSAPFYDDYTVKTMACRSSSDKELSIIVKPTPDFNVANINVCPDDNISYSLSTSPRVLTTANQSNTVWQWTNTNVAPSAITSGLGTATPPFTGTTTGITVIPGQVTTTAAGTGGNMYLVEEPNEIKLQVTVENCPSEEKSFTITVNPRPDITIEPVMVTTPPISPLICPLSDSKLYLFNAVDTISSKLRYTWAVNNSNTNLTTITTQQSIYNLPYTTVDNETSGNISQTFIATAYGLIESDISHKVCTATSTPYLITIKPRPKMEPIFPNPQLKCGNDGDEFDPVRFDISNLGSRTVTYTWENTGDPSIAGVDQTETTLSTTVTSSAAGTPGIYDITIPENISNTTITANIVVTPTMDGCEGAPTDVDLVVLQLPVVEPISDETQCPANAFNTINPNVLNSSISRIDFSVSGNDCAAPTPAAHAATVSPSSNVYVENVFDPVIFTALANNSGGYLCNEIDVRATGTVIPTGGMTGCVGPPTSFTLTVRPTPTVIAPANNSGPLETLCPGEWFALTPFRANINDDHNAIIDTDVKFTWTVTQNNIDVANASTGDVNILIADAKTNSTLGMPSFEGRTNTGGRKITSTIQVIAELDGCKSPAIVFTQRLKPTPIMTPMSDILICPEKQVGQRTITTNLVTDGATNNMTGVRWQVDNDDVELKPPATNGSNKLLPGIGVPQTGGVIVPGFWSNINPVTTPGTAPAPLVTTFTLSAVVDDCPSNEETYTVTINPTPDLIIPDDILLCVNEYNDEIYPESPSFPTGTAGLSFVWHREGVNIGIGDTDGYSPIPAFNAQNSMYDDGLSPQTSTFYVKAILETSAGAKCESIEKSLNITVLPQARMQTYDAIVACAGDPIDPKLFESVFPAGGQPVDCEYIWDWRFIDPFSPTTALDPPDEWRLVRSWSGPLVPHPNPNTPEPNLNPGNPYYLIDPPGSPTPTLVNEHLWKELDDGVHISTLGDIISPADLPANDGHLPMFVGDTARSGVTYLPNRLWAINGPTSLPQTAILRVIPQVTYPYPNGHGLNDGMLKVCNGVPQNVNVTIKPLPVTDFNPNMNLCVSDGGRIFVELLDRNPINSASGYEWDYRSETSPPAAPDNDLYKPFIPNQMPPVTTPKGEFAGKDYEVYQFEKGGVWEGYLTVQQKYAGCYAPVKEFKIITTPAPKVILSLQPIDQGVLDRIDVCSGTPFQMFAEVNGDRVTLDPTINLAWIPEPDPPQPITLLNPWKTLYYADDRPTQEVKLRADKAGCTSEWVSVYINVYPLPKPLYFSSISLCSDEEYWNLQLAPGNVVDYGIRWYVINNNGITESIINSDDLEKIDVKNTTAYPNSLAGKIPDSFRNDTTLNYVIRQEQVNDLGGGKTLTCVSNPTQGQLTVKIAPNHPEAPTMIAYCESMYYPMYELSVTSDSQTAVVNWYSDEYATNRINSGNYIQVHIPEPSDEVTPEQPGPPIIPATYKPYTYWVQATGFNQCKTKPTTKVEVTIYPNPKLSIVLEDSFGNTTAGGCAPFVQYVRNTSPSDLADYYWIWPGNIQENDIPKGTPKSTELRVNGTVPEGQIISLAAESTIFRDVHPDGTLGDFCKSQKDTLVIIQPGVKAEFVSNVKEGCEDLLVSLTSVSQGAFNYRYYWDSPAPPPWTQGPGGAQATSNDPTDPWWGISAPNPFTTLTHRRMDDQPDEYTVWLQVDNRACHHDTSMVIKVFPRPDAKFTTNVARLCPPDSIVFYNNSSGKANTGLTRYAWNFGDAHLDTVSMGNRIKYYENWNSPSPLQYTVAMTAFNKYVLSNNIDSATCSTMAMSTVTINPQVKAAFSGPVNACSPANIQFMTQALGSGSIGWYNWDFGNGTTAEVPNPLTTYINSGSRLEPIDYSVRLIVGNSWCRDTVTNLFTLYPQPSADFDIDPDNGCQPLIVTFTNTSNDATYPNPTTGMKYIFNFDDGSLYDTIPDTRTFTHKYTNTLGTLLPRNPVMTAINQWGCVSERATRLLTINPYVKADFRIEFPDNRDELIRPHCSPLTVLFRNASVGDERFDYDFGNGKVFSGNNDSGEIRTEIFETDNMYEDMTFDVKLTAWSGPCFSDTVQSLTVLSQPEANFRPASPWPGDYQWPAPSIYIDNIIKMPDREANGMTYRWSWSELGSSYVNVFSTNRYPGSLNISGWGQYTVTQQVTAPNNSCTDSKTVTITIAPPTAWPNFADVEADCAPYDVQFVNTSRNAKAYLWDFGDGYTSILEEPSHIYATDGDYTVKLIVTGYDDNQYSISKRVIVHPMPQPFFTIAPDFVFVGQAIRAFDQTARTDRWGTPYPIWYQWDWGDKSEIDTIPNPTHMYLKAGKFNVTLTVGTYTTPQCFESYTQDKPAQLELAGEILLPNVIKPIPPGVGSGSIYDTGVFSDDGGEPSDMIPDGGYRNHLFFPGIISPTQKYSMVIYNRQGVKVFETNDPKKGWNGYFRGRICDEGVYIYRIQGVFQTGESFDRMGDITLLR